MRFWLMAVLAVLALHHPARAGETLDAIKARGTLRVGSTGDYKPFTFRHPDGSFYGAGYVLELNFIDDLGGIHEKNSKGVRRRGQERQR